MKPGKRNRHVFLVKKRLKRKGFYKAKNTTNFYGSAMANAYARYQESLGYTGKDADGTPGKSSLNKLGFRVVK